MLYENNVFNLLSLAPSITDQWITDRINLIDKLKLIKFDLSCSISALETDT